MRVAILGSLFLWGFIIILIVLCLSDFARAEAREVIKVRTYYKPGYQSVSSEWAKTITRIAIRRTEREFPVRFSHTFRQIPATVAAYERDYQGCYRIPGFEGEACCPNEYIERHYEQTDAWWRGQKLNEVAMFINPPVGANSYYGDRWLSGGIAKRRCYGGIDSIGIINATEVNALGESRRRSMIEVYRHELYHTVFYASHQEKPKPLNIMQTFSPEYNQVEQITSGEFGLPVSVRTKKEAAACIQLNKKEKFL